MSKLGEIALRGLELPELNGRERSVLRHIADCQTERMGGNVLSCECGLREMHYNSCRDRHCPLCLFDITLNSRNSPSSLPGFRQGVIMSS